MTRWLALVFLFLTACSPRLQDSGPMVRDARIEADQFIARDGTPLPIRHWTPKSGNPWAVILAFHGFNDYAPAFDTAATFWARHGVLTYAIDQRGFGKSPHTGLWAGVATMKADLDALIGAAKKRHGNLPIYLVGDSMGGAVVMTTLAGRANDTKPAIAGAVLVAPAVWGRKHLGLFKRSLLWLSAHTAPWLKLSGKGLGIQPSDNIEMLKKLSADKLVIKKTRIDTIWGLVNLMDGALKSAPHIKAPVLLLYGARDEIIPSRPTKEVAQILLKRPHTRIAVYDAGYHMLLRDLQAETVFKDVLAWLKDQKATLPSNAEKRAQSWVLEIN